jgi:prolyl oligopeptidase
MIYGYGGFSISTLPTYRQDVPAWLEMGGVWVTASMRGGAEYGEKWHEAGMLDRKQNVFDDFIAVAEHLVSEKYTSPAKLGVMGGSNGGLLVGAVINQRPDTLRGGAAGGGRDGHAALRPLHRRPTVGAGVRLGAESGAVSVSHQILTGAEREERRLLSGDARDHADHDDRVVPSHSFKYAAAMQAAQGCAKPILIRVEVSGSHGYRPTDKLIAERADQWAFAAQAMGIK